MHALLLCAAFSVSNTADRNKPSESEANQSAPNSSDALSPVGAGQNVSALNPPPKMERPVGEIIEQFLRDLQKHNPAEFERVSEMLQKIGIKRSAPPGPETLTVMPKELDTFEISQKCVTTEGLAQYAELRPSSFDAHDVVWQGPPLFQGTMQNQQFIWQSTSPSEYQSDSVYRLSWWLRNLDWMVLTLLCSFIPLLYIGDRIDQWLMRRRMRM